MCLPPITVVNSPTKKHCSRPRVCDSIYRVPFLEPLSPESYGRPAELPPIGVITAVPSSGPRCPPPTQWIEGHRPCQERAQAPKEEKPKTEVVYIKEAKKKDSDQCPCSSKNRCTCGNRRRRCSSVSSSSSRSYKEVKRKVRDLWDMLDQDRCRARREERHRAELEMQRDRRDMRELEKRVRREVDTVDTRWRSWT
ncbi:MAG: hypothetical protein Q9191_003168 [Dirinaria sp. TL-2023a]